MYIDLANEGKECFANRWGLVSQAKLGHDVTLICGGNNKVSKTYTWNGINVIELPVFLELTGTSRFIKGFITELMNINADVLHTHHYGSFVPEITAMIGKLRKIPVFVTFHSSFKAERGIRHVLEIVYKLLMQPFSVFYKKVFFMSDYIMSVSPYVLLPNKKKVLCYNHYKKYPIENKLLQFKRKANTILFIGRLEHTKGVDMLLKAYAIIRKKHPNTKLHIVGSGNEEDKLIRLTKKLGICKNTTYHGSQYGAKKLKMLYTHSMLVVANRDIGLGNVPIEAYIRSMPVIVSSHWTLPANIRNNSELRKRMVFKLEDYKDLAEKITYFLENKQSAAKISKIVENKTKYFVDNSCAKTMLKEYMQAI